MTAIYLFKLLLLPPASLLVLAFAGLCLRKHRFGIPLASISLSVLTLLSLPVISQILAGTLETFPILDRKQIESFQPQAIVVIGGGSTEGLEYQQTETVNAGTLVRLRYAAKLARDSHLPVLVSGGKVFPHDTLSEAQMMARVLQNEFHTDFLWQEPASRNTAENARFSRQLLQAHAIDRILLVTQAYHIPRAVWSFHDAGFQVLAAPTGFFSIEPPLTILSFVPSARALEQSFLVLHEYLGLLWYKTG